MRYLVSCLLAMPLLGSCTVVEEHYYGREYYAPAPRVEVQPHYAERHHHHVNAGYRAVPNNRVYYSGNTVVVNPRQAQAVMPNNVRKHSGNMHGHNGNAATVHGHTNNPNVHGHGNNGTVHGHGPSVGNGVVQHPQANGTVKHVKPNTGKVVQGHHQNSNVQNKAHGHR
ncbi:hypothetical protein [uncultured Legionella sp.]|uniref:hypothetical protein n=1 Tax=uncultured Legionella sp. TaxID=210934 RepID=UPI00260BF675|nr:hypothetical protein [uncultured Legionella sp.]